MRHFIVLGYSSHSQREAGEVLCITTDRAEAISVTDTEGEQVRRELFELAVPAMRRSFAGRVPSAAGRKRTNK